ncbi:MAG: sulfatase-like hydrolase/transferase, partial [Verrucomicrobiae bacterium]|nr:sulfatase-like hydrolase/transferase [Verrucomicrobiae bacterium]
RPNIILIFSDDGGYNDLDLHGNPDFPTPELDSLATAGVRFTDHYVTGGVCHPSRCGLLSGIYQQRHGTDNNLSGPSYVGLATSQRTVPRRLQGLGYRTYGIGKWHLGDTVEFHPNCRGFDRWYGMSGGSRSYYDAGESENQVFQDQMTPDFANENTGYLTDRIGDATVDFIDEHLGSSHAAEPFYIYVSFTAIHGPMDIKAMDPRFDRLQNEFGLTAADYQNSPIVFSGSNQTTVDANRYELAAMTLAMDEQIGKIVAKLDAEGLSSNTLVVYTNDNGGAGWTQASGGNYSYNTPLRGYKGGSMTDGSIRVACAAKWPGTIPAGQVVEDPVISLDWGATFVNAAGDAPAQARNGLDGIDLMPRLTSGAPLPAERMMFWRAGGHSGGGSAARMGDWKLLID